MANYTEAFTSKLDWAMPFQRTGKFPLDRTDLFSSKADAEKYAAGNTSDPDSRALCGTSYIGQVITVFENDTVKCYIINASRKLDEVGSATLGDGKSIVLSNGILAIKGFAEAIAAGSYNGKTPRINAVGEIEWVLPDTTTVEGIQELVTGLQSDVNTLTEAVNNKVDKVEGKGLSTNDYTTAEKEKLAGIATGAQVNILEGIKVNGTAKTPTDKVVDITVPTKLSELSNDKNFIDNTVTNLQNYYDKSSIDTMVGNLATIQVTVVDTLPTTGASNIIYLVAKTTSEEGNVYDEYLWTGTTFEKIGSTKIDLTPYAKKEDLADVATTGKYEDLLDRPSTVESVSGTIAVGATSTTLNLPEGATLVNVIAKDALNEIVILDITNSGTSVVAELSEAYSSAITITASYLVSP